MTWLWIILYTMIALVLWRRWAGYLAITESKWDWGFGALFGGIGALFWPVVVGIWVIVKTGSPMVMAFVNSTHWLWTTRNEREVRQKLRAKAVEQAEKEVGLGQKEMVDHSVDELHPRRTRHGDYRYE